jgi:hypothetical protein
MRWMFEVWLEENVFRYDSRIGNKVGGRGSEYSMSKAQCCFTVHDAFVLAVATAVL